jgi:hypothetical protein
VLLGDLAGAEAMDASPGLRRGLEAEELPLRGSIISLSQWPPR